MHGLQRAISWIYPDQCQLCPNLVEVRGGLCPDCWRQTPFLSGLICNTCGCALPGESACVEYCDDCLADPRPWIAGRAALSYRDYGRRIVLALKHGDRTELAGPGATWMWRAGKAVVPDGALIVPVPVHWSRLIRRRYNQSAELARALRTVSGLDCGPDVLLRVRRTAVQDGMSAEERQANVAGAIIVNEARRSDIAGRDICLVDDVMTTGATLSACSHALLDGGARQVFVLVLARVEKST